MAQHIGSSTVKSNKKRNATMAGLQGNATGRSVKRRAAKACQCCRARKVRCNVVEHGSPCTNCRLDEIDCVVSESKRKKKFQGAKTDSNRGVAAEARAEARKASIASSTNTKTSRGISQLPYSPVSPSRQSFISSSTSTSSIGDFDRSHECHVPHLIYQSQSQKLSRHRQGSQTSSIHPTLSVQSTWNQSSYNPAFTQPAFSPSYRPSLPSYLKPLSPELSADDFQHLTARGALVLPAPWLLSQLLLSYQDFVHPALPVLDFSSISKVVERGDGSNGQISLLLHHAIAYAASSYVNAEQLRAAGYISKKDARADFFDKAKIVESVNDNSSPLSLVQCLILMSSSEAGTPIKNSWHYLGTAISLAQTMGLHRDCSSNPTIDVHAKRLRKRIWWCLYAQDRLQGLEQRRQPRIRDGEYDVPMLSMEDFEISSGAEHEIQLAELFISKTKLCLIISAVLNARFNPFAVSNPSPSISNCTTALSTWSSTLPTFASVDSSVSKASADPLFLHKANLQLLHASAVLTLHQSSVSLEKSPSPITHLLKKTTATTTSLASQLLASYLSPHLPSYIVPALHIAAQSHLATICKSQDHQAATSGLSTLLRLIHLLRESYDSADAAFSNLQTALHASPLSRSFEATRAKALTPPPDSSVSYAPGLVMPNDEWEAVQAITPPLSALCEGESPELGHSDSTKMYGEQDVKDENFDSEFWGMVNLDCDVLGGEDDAEGDVDIEL